MKILARVGLPIVAGIFVLSASPAFAWDCSNTHKTVTGYYEKTAKKAGVDQAKLAQAKKLLDQGDQAHKAGNHRLAMDHSADAMKLITSATP